MSESLIVKVVPPPFYEIQCDLWGASWAWIEAVEAGASRLGAYFTKAGANPAFAGVQARTDDLATAKAIDSYFRRCSALALYQGNREMARENAQRVVKRAEREAKKAV